MTDKIQPSEIQDLMKNKIWHLKLTEIPADELSTDACHVITAAIGKVPNSMLYGKIIGYFYYQDNVYEFKFHVHRPNQKYAHLSNKMTDIQEVQNKNGYLEHIDTDFGTMAFWEKTPMSYLQEKQNTKACALRELMLKITQYSRTHDLCRKFRKTDKQALRINPIYKAKER